MLNPSSYLLSCQEACNWLQRLHLNPFQGRTGTYRDLVRYALLGDRVRYLKVPEDEISLSSSVWMILFSDWQRRYR